MKTTITQIPVAVYATSLCSILLFLSSVFQKDSRYEERSNEIVKLVTSYYHERYGDQFYLYDHSFRPRKEIGDYLNLYESFLTEGAQNIVKKRLSEYVGESTLDSIRTHELNNSWQNFKWKNESIRLTSDMDRKGNEIKLFISSILFNPSFDRAILYMETHKESSVTGLIYALRLESNGEWRWAPGIPALFGD